MDWGLWQAGSKRWGLRNTLLISHEEPWPYYAAVAMDFLLRLTWLARLHKGWMGFTDLVLTLELIEVLHRMRWLAVGERGWLPSVVFQCTEHAWVKKIRV